MPFEVAGFAVEHIGGPQRFEGFYLAVAPDDGDRPVTLVCSYTDDQFGKLAGSGRDDERFGFVLLDDAEHGEGGERVDDHGGAVFVADAVYQRDAAGGIRNGEFAPRAGSAGGGNESNSLAKVAIGEGTAPGGDHFSDAFESGGVALDAGLAVEALDEHLVGRVDRRQRHLDPDLPFAGFGHRQVAQMNERFHRSQRGVVGTLPGVTVALEDECLHRVGHCRSAPGWVEAESIQRVARLAPPGNETNQHRTTKH